MINIPTTIKKKKIDVMRLFYAQKRYLLDIRVTERQCKENKRRQDEQD